MTVPQYLAAVPPERRDALTRMRKLCRGILSSYEESIEYGMPGYKLDGKVEVAFASQKNYISFYILKEAVMREHAPLFKGLSVGKGCIRFRRVDSMDFKAIETVLRATIASAANAC